MLQYRDGEGAAFDVLYARHRGPVYRYLLHQTGKREVADELFQDVWLRVINARSGYEATAKFTTWLYRIAGNRLTDHYRRQGVHAATIMEQDAEADAAPVVHEAPAALHEQPPQALERQQLAQRLITALAVLPPEQRQAFLLAAEGELTVEEIGRACDVGYETAKSRLRYAYQRLRILLSDLRP